MLRALITASLLLLAPTAHAEAQFQRGPTQYIAALGDTAATSGDHAESWGFWELDPGPRGVRVKNYPAMLANAGKAPAGWAFDPAGWWLEEHGLLMETPAFPLPAGAYVVTGGREKTAVLTVAAPDAAGHQSWSLSDSATLYDVTHLGCRAALYTPQSGAACTPEKTPLQVFPMEPNRQMPPIEGCMKQDYQVLIVVGRMVGA